MPLALVTGANRGLGLESARRLGERGWSLLLAIRREAEERAAAATLAKQGVEVRAWTVDLSDGPSIDRLAARVADDVIRLDALVQNAGVYAEGAAGEILAVNLLAPVRLTDALVPRLSRGARVVMVSSGLGQLDGLPRDLRDAVEGIRTRSQLLQLASGFARAHPRAGSLAYAVSKAGLNAYTRLLAPELAPAGIRVNAVCPGWVRTGMGGPSAPRTVEEAAAGIVWAATLPPDGPTGGFFRDGQPIPW
jgi:NAD(P)-dependent dehydrogenase (short-subunit alcohol dehydrogenase family)